VHRILRSSLLLSAGLGAVLSCAACATTEPEQKKPVVDEFQGFAALRGEPREKKKPKEEQPEQAAAEPEAAPGKGEEEKTALTKEQVLGAIATAQKRVDSCLKKHKDPGIYVLEITISPDGSSAAAPQRAPTRKEEPELWSEVEAGVDGGKNPKSPTSRCLATAISQIKFPTFSGKALVVTYPLVLR